MGMLEALVMNDAQNAIFGVVRDPAAAAAAHEAGVGAELELDLGGMADLDGRPVPRSLQSRSGQ